MFNWLDWYQIIRSPYINLLSHDCSLDLGRTWILVFWKCNRDIKSLDKKVVLTSPLGSIFCSSSLKEVPILLRTIGGSSPGSRGYSFGNFPVSSCKHTLKKEFRYMQAPNRSYLHKQHYSINIIYQKSYSTVLRLPGWEMYWLESIQICVVLCWIAEYYWFVYNYSKTGCQAINYHLLSDVINMECKAENVFANNLCSFLWSSHWRCYDSFTSGVSLQKFYIVPPLHLSDPSSKPTSLEAWSAVSSLQMQWCQNGYPSICSEESSPGDHLWVRE